MPLNVILEIFDFHIFDLMTLFEAVNVVGQSSQII